MKSVNFIFFGIFVLVPFEILSHYPNIDSSSLAERRRSVDHRLSFQRKAYSLKNFDNFFSQFSSDFLVFACFCCCFHTHTTYCDVLMITYALRTSLFSHQGISERIY